MQTHDRDLEDAPWRPPAAFLRGNGPGAKFGPAPRTVNPDRQDPGHFPVRHGTGAHAPRMEPTSVGRHEWLERTLRERVIPELPRPRAPHPAGTADAALREAPGVRKSEVEALVRLLRTAEEGQAGAYVRSLLATGTALDALYLELLAPAARRLGAMWEEDECDFVEVTLGLGRLQRLLRDLSQLFLAPATPANPVGAVLLTCLAGEQHTLGLVMVGEFFLRDGWHVLVGAPWTEDDLMTMVRTQWFDVIGYSVGSTQRLPALRREIRRLTGASRNPHLQIMVGGQLFADQPTLVAEVGAHACALDARQAPQVARTLLAASRADTPAFARQEALGGRGQLGESHAIP